MALLGLSIPVVIAGVATAHLGLHRTALAHCAAMAALVAVAAGSLLLRRRRPATGQGTGQAGPGSTAAIGRGGTGRAGRPSGMVPYRAAVPDREPVAVAPIRETAGGDQRRRKPPPGRTGSARRPSPVPTPKRVEQMNLTAKATADSSKTSPPGRRTASGQPSGT
jgi:hypothetical protein